MSDEENSDLFSLVHKMTAKVDQITGATLVAVHNGKEAGQEILMFMYILFQEKKVIQQVQFIACLILRGNYLILK